MKIKLSSYKIGLFIVTVTIFVLSCKTKKTTSIPPAATGTASFSNNLTPVKTEYKRVKVSWFEDLFYKRNVSGKSDSYDQKDLLAAHRTLPIGTIVELVNPENNNAVQVKIAYRGPATSGRDFDLSKKAFKKLTDPDLGLIYVDYKIIK